MMAHNSTASQKEAQEKKEAEEAKKKKEVREHYIMWTSLITMHRRRNRTIRPKNCQKGIKRRPTRKNEPR
jgi:hypothetical protein